MKFQGEEFMPPEQRAEYVVVRCLTDNNDFVWPVSAGNDVICPLCQKVKTMPVEPPTSSRK